MGIYKKLHASLVRNKPNIMQEYSNWLRHHKNNSISERIRSYLYLLNLLRKEKKATKIKQGEYSDNLRIPKEKLLSKLMKYDVISFDLFDALVFRSVDDKEKLYNLIALQKEDDIFSISRYEAEKYIASTQPHYNIYDIYDEIKRRGQVSKVELQDEFNVELSLCEPNPYMYYIYEELKKANKKIVVLVDTYWTKEYIQQILKKCGYDFAENIYASCEMKKSKQVGDAYTELVSMFPEMKQIHIGSNYQIDYKSARKNGCKAYYYESVSDRGNKYRNYKYYDGSLAGAISNSIINQELHNGICDMTPYEQYGFTYGGKLVTGYCHYINEQVHEKQIDKLLFLARDANIIHKIYNEFYCECDNEYVYASRNSVLPIVFEQYTDLFIDKVLLFRATTTAKTIEKTLQETGLECLISKLSEVGIAPNNIFDKNCLQRIIPIIYQYKKEIVNGFSEQRQAAKKYFCEVIGDAKRIAFVDIGWHGTIMVCLKQFLKQECGLDIDIVLFQIGTFQERWNECELRNNKILSYCFSTEFNCDMCSHIRFDIVKIGLFELMFTANHPSLLCYSEASEDKLMFDNNCNSNSEAVEQLQGGMILYAKKYQHIENIMQRQFSIGGLNAVKSILHVLNNREYVFRLFKDFHYSILPGTEDKTTLKTYF